MLRECWTQVLLAQPMSDTAISDSKELLWEQAVLAQSFCKGRGIMESALDWHVAQLKVSLVTASCHWLGVSKEDVHTSCGCSYTSMPLQWLYVY